MPLTAHSRFFFFNDTATTEIYTLSLHDALPIFGDGSSFKLYDTAVRSRTWVVSVRGRSEEHTSELQSRLHLVCRLLLEKKKKTSITEMHQLSMFCTPVVAARAPHIMPLVSIERG